MPSPESPSGASIHPSIQLALTSNRFWPKVFSIRMWSWSYPDPDPGFPSRPRHRWRLRGRALPFFSFLGEGSNSGVRVPCHGPRTVNRVEHSFLYRVSCHRDCDEHGHECGYETWGSGIEKNHACTSVHAIAICRRTIRCASERRSSYGLFMVWLWCRYRPACVCFLDWIEFNW